MRAPAQILVLAAIVLAPSLVRAAPDARTSAPDPQGIYGGTPVPVCAWPSNVGLYGATTTCSASLVHPELVVTAGHCLEGGPLTTLFLGDDAYAPAFEVPLAGCVQHPSYALDYPDYADFMFCRLAQPLVGVPTVPILMGCETDAIAPGASAVLTGYGLADDGLPEGRKRMVTTSVDYLEDSRVFFVGGTGKGTCSGDSGGPSYVQLADGTWRVFGTTTGGESCGDAGQSELIHVFVPWIEQETGIDITPCHDADGTWVPSEDCVGFPARPDAPPSGSWDALCGGAPVTPPSATCGPAYGDEPEPPSDSDGEGGDSGPPADSGDDGGVDDGAGSSGDGGSVGDADDAGTDAWPWPADPTSARGESTSGCAVADARGSLALFGGLAIALRSRRRRALASCRPRG